MQHRFAYVGNDLQDLYGIDALHIGDVTSISNAFFANGDAQKTLTALNGQLDGVLVSEETAKDFQLSPGDTLNLRLQYAKDHQYHVVPFHFVGIVREFPTAPKDSFLVANSRYIAARTGSDAGEIVLMKATGDLSKVAAGARKVTGSMAGVKVTDLQSTQRMLSSSLTAVDLRGLTTIELSFAVLLVAMATGLILAMGLADRRRTFAILVAIGAKSKQLGAFLWSESLLVLVGGGLAGVLLGFGIAQTLVKVLTGVFDPPPAGLAIPWDYLVPLGFAAIASTVIVVLGAKFLSRRRIIEELRSL
jgi:putative ABC transport system permease protein